MERTVPTLEYIISEIRKKNERDKRVDDKMKKRRRELREWMKLHPDVVEEIRKRRMADND